MEKLSKLSFPLVSLVLGSLFLILGLAGKISIGKELSTEVFGTTVRLISGIIGSVLILVAIICEVSKLRRAKRQNRIEGTRFYSLDEEIGGVPVFAKGARRLQLTCRTGINLLSQYSAFFKELGNAGCDLELLFVDPSSPAAASVYGPNSEHFFQKNIAAVVPHLQEMRKIFHDRLKIKKLNYLPTTSIMIIHNDKESFARVSFYFMHARVGRDRPIFRLPSSDSWYNCFAQEVSELWKNGQDWNDLLISEK